MGEENEKVYKVRKSYFCMQTTKLSTKGQIVIPDSLRKGFDEGTLFRIIRKNDLIVFVKNVEEFVGLEGENVGPFEKEQIVNLPKEIAKILVDDKKAEYVIE